MNEPKPLPETASKPPISNYLTMGDLRMAYEVLEEIFSGDPEPLPSWEHADRHRLADCRACIEVEAFGVKKYPDLPSAVAKLFYSTIKLHAFPNGNKRYALALSVLLLVKNGYRPTASGLAGVAKWVAEADPHDPETSPDRVVATLAQFYEQNIAQEPRLQQAPP